MSRLKELRKYINKELKKMPDKDDWISAVSHLYGVSLAATMLAKKRGFDPELAAMAAMLHDLHAYKTGSYDDHAHKGADLARRILTELELTGPDETEMICSAIYHHDDKLSVDGPMDELLKDADVIHHTLNDTAKPIKEKEQARYDRIMQEFGIKSNGINYQEIVRNAKEITRSGYGSIDFRICELWEQCDQINLWTYWQGYQLKDFDEKGVDILLVGQDWGDPERNPKVLAAIKNIMAGKEDDYVIDSPTDATMVRMFKAFGKRIDITKKDPGLRLFFTNYCLGYRNGSETGGMTKEIMRQDEEVFNDLVLAIKPKIIICLGKITYEMVSGTVVKGFVKQLSEGVPFKAPFPLDKTITVYGVAHCGARGRNNVGGEENMKKAWKRIAGEFNR